MAESGPCLAVKDVLRRSEQIPVQVLYLKRRCEGVQILLNSPVPLPLHLLKLEHGNDEQPSITFGRAKVTQLGLI